MFRASKTQEVSSWASTALAGMPGWVPARPHDSAASRQRACRFTNVALTGLAAMLFLTTAAVYSYCIIFSKFHHYDDEGYVMVGLQGYLEGAPLYDSVASPYGPIHFFWQWLLHTLGGLPVTHDVTGWICLVHWLAAAVLLGLVATRMSRSTLLGFFVFMQAVPHLFALSNEPGHPQELIAVLLAFTALAATRGLERHGTFSILGAIAAALLFTKINVGVFYLLPLLLTLAWSAQWLQPRPGLRAALLTCVALVPLVLVASRWTEPWAREFGLQATLAALAAGMLAAGLDCPTRLPLRRWLEIAGAFLATCVLILAILLATGTSLCAAFECLVVVPSKVLGGFCLPFRAPGCLWSGGTSVMVAGLFVAYRNRLPQLRWAILLLKGVYGVIGTLVLVSYTKLQLWYLLPWTWLLLAPVAPRPLAQPNALLRVFLCFIALWQPMQAYPVTGTQVSVGTLPLVLVYSLCLYDSFTALAALPWKSWRPVVGLTQSPLLARGFGLLLLLALFAGRWCVAGKSWNVYCSLSPLDLPGARCLRLQPHQVKLYHELSDYLQRECDTFITIPGLNSLHFWTGKCPPTYFNVAEVLLLSERQQQQVVAALQSATRPLIVINEQRRLASWDSAILGEGPVARFVQTSCVEVTRLNGCRILAPRRQQGRADTIAP